MLIHLMICCITDEQINDLLYADPSLIFLNTSNSVNTDEQINDLLYADPSHVTCQHKHWFSRFQLLTLLYKL